MFNKSYLLAFCFGVAIMTFSSSLYAQVVPRAQAQNSLQEARELCGSLSESKKRLAQSNGYDLDKLCSSLNTPVKKASREVNLQVMARKPKKAVDNQQTLPEADKLQAFGYDLFAGEPTSFQPASRIPVSPGYVLGPGDTLKVLFYGNSNKSYNLEIDRDGSLGFPELGPVYLAGMTFSDAKELLNKRVQKEMIGVEASISLGELRSIQVFMLGEAYKPGTYTISALSTMTNALSLSGGLSDIASLRNLQLKRSGKVVAKLDLYDLLLNGDTSNDVQLQSADTIFIPTVGKTASIAGQVRRPAIYELKGQVSAHELVKLAGGLKPTAFSKSARIHRIGSDGFMGVVDVDLSTSIGQQVLIENGDQLLIDGAVKRQEMVVTLSGHVHYPGTFLWRKGLRISDLIKNSNSLKSNADLDFALIKREQPPVGEIETLFVDLRAVLSDTKSSANITFLPRDELIVFSNSLGRAQNFSKLIESLKLQSRSGEIAKVVSINGTVRSPGEYPLTKGMTLTQLIAVAGGLKEEAYTQTVEFSRRDFDDVEQASEEHFFVALKDALADSAKDPQLQPYDMVSVRTTPEFRENLHVKLMGEVRFPGKYPFKRGETLSEVVKRAGGLTEFAHVNAAVFTRNALLKQEGSRLKMLSERLRSDIISKSFESLNAGESMPVQESMDLLEKLEGAQALGRMVINLPEVLDGTASDIRLQDGDLLVIPEYRQEVTVIGEVQYPSSHAFNREHRIDDYLGLSGGVNNHADEKQIYVVKANGSVSMMAHSGWFRSRSKNIEPGDTVVVPLNADRIRRLTIWGEASAIIYQLSLGAAAINSF